MERLEIIIIVLSILISVSIIVAVFVFGRRRNKLKKQYEDDEFRERISEVTKRIIVRQCENCDSIIGIDIVFCKICGAKQRKMQ